MKHDAISVTAMLALTAFAIERVCKGVLFLLSFVPGWDWLNDGGTSTHLSKVAKLIYVLLAGALVLIVLLLIPSMRVLEGLGMQAPPWLLDAALTWLVLVAGSERISDLMAGRAATDPPAPPVQIMGEVTVHNAEQKKAAGAGS